MFSTRKAVLAASVASAALALTASPAMANSPTAYHQKLQYLKWNPNPQTDPQTCMAPESIELAAGVYHWNVIFEGAAIRSEPITLKADTYTWTDCLQPVYDIDGTSEYQETTTLTPSSGGTARFGKIIRISPAMGSGYYQWGSDLAPQF